MSTPNAPAPAAPRRGEMEQNGTAFERRIEMTPAFDKRDPNPAKDYGIGAVRIRFVLIGPEGATHFLMSSGWYLPHNARVLMATHAGDPDRLAMSVSPSGWDIGYHSTVPRYDGQQPTTHQCEYVKGGVCYSDGSALAAEPVMDALLRGGSDAVWRELERRYADLFTPAEVTP